MSWARNFPADPGDIFRFYKGDEVTLRITPPRDLSLSRGFLHLNTPSGNPGGSWEIRPMNRGGGGEFSLTLPLDRCGLYRYRFFGRRPEEGSPPLWDPVPYASCLVDPLTVRGLKLYTFIPSVSGPISGWREKLENIRDLGFNAVGFLPLTQAGASLSPYSVADHFSIDRVLLGAGEEGWEVLNRLAADAESLGLRLCFDLVLNHVAVDGKLAAEHPDWIEADPEEPDGFRRAGCWHRDSWICWKDLAKINFQHPDPSVRQKIWRHMGEYALRWGRAAVKTGGFLRLDNLHSSDPDFVQYLGDTLSAALPDLFFLAEYFDDPKVLARRVGPWHLNLLIANPWERPFVPQLREYLKELNRAGTPRNLVPLCTHDTEAPAVLYGDPASTVPRYFTGAVMTGGQTGLVQGVEDGVGRKVEFIGHNLSMPEHTPGLFHKEIRAVNRLLDEEPLLHCLGNLSFVDHGHDTIIAAIRVDPQRQYALLLAANFDIHAPQVLNLEPPPAGLRGIVDSASLGTSGLNSLEPLLPGIPTPRGRKLVLPPCGIAAFRLRISLPSASMGAKDKFQRSPAK